MESLVRTTTRSLCTAFGPQRPKPIVGALFAALLYAVAAPASAQTPLQLHTRWLEADADTSQPRLAIGVDEEPPNVVRAVSAASTDTGRQGTSGPSSSVGTHVQPAGKVIGVGLQLGFPTGITAKVMAGGNLGFVFGAGLGVGWVLGPALSLHADSVWHPFILLQSEDFQFSWYIGGGGWLGFNPLEAFPGGGLLGNSALYSGWKYLAAYRLHTYGVSAGLRLPLGLSLALNGLPIEVYGDLVPSLLLFPALGLGLGADVGVRLYF